MTEHENFHSELSVRMANRKPRVEISGVESYLNQKAKDILKNKPVPTTEKPFPTKEEMLDALEKGEIPDDGKGPGDNKLTTG